VYLFKEAPFLTSDVPKRPGQPAYGLTCRLPNKSRSRLIQEKANCRYPSDLQMYILTCRLRLGSNLAGLLLRVDDEVHFPIFEMHCSKETPTEREILICLVRLGPVRPRGLGCFRLKYSMCCLSVGAQVIGFLHLRAYGKASGADIPNSAVMQLANVAGPGLLEG
jgi:hypothetical protein